MAKVNSARVWRHALYAAVITAVSNGIICTYASPTTINWTHEGMVVMAKIIAGNILLTVFSYLKQSPLPPGNDNDSETLQEIAKDQQK